VSNLKLGIIFGAAALVISVSLGVIFDVGSFHIFIRALVFTLVFTGLGFGINFLINNFLPELLRFDEEGSSAQDSFDSDSGRRVNIIIGNAKEYAVPEMFRNAPDAGEIGNIEDLISGAFRPPPRAEPAAAAYKEGIDRRPEEDYNIQGASSTAGAEPVQAGASDFSAPPQKEEPAVFQKPVFTPSFGDDSDDLAALPDLGSMAGAFSSKDGAETFAFGGGAGFEAAPALGNAESVLPSTGGEDSYNKGNKPQPLEGDFTAQELAKGISSILAQEK
jgi:hypothetical protein